MRRPSSTCRCSAPACGRWARPSGCRCCSECRGSRRRSHMRINPLVRNYLTKDGHWLALCCLQAGKYWPTLWRRASGSRSSATDERFADHEALMANSPTRRRSCRRCFAPSDPGGVARGARRLHRAVDRRAGHPAGRGGSADGRQRLRAAVHDADGRAVPDDRRTGAVRRGATATRRAPEFNEHGDAILAELGSTGTRSSTSRSAASSRSPASDHQH